jgi:hypothetical protein
MQGLFRKITKGVYEPIPNYYSADLKLVLSDFLKVTLHYKIIGKTSIETKRRLNSIKSYSYKKGWRIKYY